MNKRTRTLMDMVHARTTLRIDRYQHQLAYRTSTYLSYRHTCMFNHMRIMCLLSGYLVLVHWRHRPVSAVIFVVYEHVMQFMQSAAGPSADADSGSLLLAADESHVGPNVNLACGL